VIDAFEVRMRGVLRHGKRGADPNQGEPRRAAQGVRDHRTVGGRPACAGTSDDGRNAVVAFLKADLSFHLLLLKAEFHLAFMIVITNAYQSNHFAAITDSNATCTCRLRVGQHAEIERAVRRGTGRRGTLDARHIAWSLADALGSVPTATAEHAVHGAAAPPPKTGADEREMRTARCRVFIDCTSFRPCCHQATIGH
jgi:hypothetical protein